MKFSSLIFAAILLLPAQAALAQSPQPGLWRMKITSQTAGMPGMPAEAEDETKTHCLTPEMARDPLKGFKPEGETKACKYNGNWTGSQLSYEMACGGDSPMTMKATYNFESPTRFRGTMNVVMSGGGQRIQSTMQMEGQRVGECPRS
jgi:hypothetical protein